MERRKQMEGKIIVLKKHRARLSFFVGGNFSEITEWNSFVITEYNFVFTEK
jgi:hypothetical protein